MKKLRFSQNKDILFIFVVYFILHLFMRFISWDDPYFISALEKANYRLFSLLEKRYLCWSSRTVIELLLFVLGALPKIVWRLLDSIVISLFYCYLKKITHIFFPSNSHNDKLLLLCFLCWPFSTMGTTGWLSSTTNTLWVLVAILYSALVFYKKINGENMPIKEYIFFYLCLVYSCNHESALPIYALLLTGFLFISMLRKSLDIHFFISSLSIYVISAIWILHCPGNFNRLEGEQNKVGYLTISLFDKIRMGINTTFYHYVSVPNIVLFLLCLTILLSVCQKHKSFHKRLLGALPLILDIGWTTYLFLRYTLTRGYLTYSYPDEHFVEIGKTEQYFALVSCMLIFILFIYNIYILLEIHEHRFLLMFILLLSALPEIELALTPAISASIMRTVIYLYTAFLLIIFILVNKFLIHFKKWQTILITFSAICGAIMNILQIIRHMMIYG